MATWDEPLKPLRSNSNVPADTGIEVKTIKVNLFTWEKLDSVATIQKAFGL